MSKFSTLDGTITELQRLGVTLDKIARAENCMTIEKASCTPLDNCSICMLDDRKIKRVKDKAKELLSRSNKLLTNIPYAIQYLKDQGDLDKVDLDSFCSAMYFKLDEKDCHVPCSKCIWSKDKSKSIKKAIRNELKLHRFKGDDSQEYIKALPTKTVLFLRGRGVLDEFIKEAMKKRSVSDFKLHVKGFELRDSIHAIRWNDTDGGQDKWSRVNETYRDWLIKESELKQYIEEPELKTVKKKTKVLDINKLLTKRKIKLKTKL